MRRLPQPAVAPAAAGTSVANVFVLGQRFPFVELRCSPSGEGDGFQEHTLLDDVANERNTLGMFGAGFIELLAREITVDLQAHPRRRHRRRRSSPGTT